MGLMRRVESSTEGVAAETHTPAASGTASTAMDGGSARRVHPRELEQKLVKEMEDHRVFRPGKISVSSRFVIYLCPADYDHVSSRLDTLVGKLERALAKHVRAKNYEVIGELTVRVNREPDLRPGYFGILAEPIAADAPAAGPRPSHGRPAAAAAGLGAPLPAASTSSAAVVRKGPSVVAHEPSAVDTQIIPPDSADHPSAASQAIVIRVGNRVKEFNQSRVVLGRARGIDFRIDDPNVSRRHAALYWADGQIMVEDLDSTNGTLVNGSRVRVAALRPEDALVLGDSRVVVEIGSD
jgi:hypothetical protein